MKNILKAIITLLISVVGGFCTYLIYFFLVEVLGISFIAVGGLLVSYLIFIPLFLLTLLRAFISAYPIVSYSIIIVVGISQIPPLTKQVKKKKEKIRRLKSESNT